MIALSISSATGVIMKRSLIVLGLVSLFATVSYSQTVKDESHRRYFDREMSGVESRESKIPCETLNKLFGYSETLKNGVELACDVRPWSYKGKSAFAVVLLRDDASTNTMDVGVVDCLPTPKLLAKLGETQERDYQFSLDRFDPLLFDLGSLGKAVGLRAHKGGCGAGGSICADGILQLYVVDDGIVRMVFDSQMDYFGSYGGEWNADGTRDHEIEEEESVLVIGKGNPPSLIKKMVGKKAQKQTFTWNAASKSYKTKDPEIMTSIDR